MEQEKAEYYVEGEFIFHSYSPVKLDKGMKFITKRVVNGGEPELFVFTLMEIPKDEEQFMAINGAPITINILSTGEDPEILAIFDEIGFFDDGNGVVFPLTDEVINKVINNFGGVMNIECDETGDPILYYGKVIISYLSNLEEEEGES